MVPAAAGTPSVNLRPLGVAIGSRRSMVAYYRARGLYGCAAFGRLRRQASFAVGCAAVFELSLFWNQ
ncbi:hypothetical protein C4K28_3688 [Pseudomonas chlororaphis subsp. piscium]|nr:hypothetical protein C4K28_3688 [Pseudomonas chlororaphis subsp. piscium]